MDVTRPRIMGQELLELEAPARSLPLAARAMPRILLGHETGEVQHQVQDFFAGIPELFETWVRRRKSAETRRAYRRDVLTFTEWMGWSWPSDAAQLLSVSVGQVQAYRDWLAASYSPKTVTRRVCSLSSWYKFLSAAAAELRLPINLPNPAHSQFLPRGAADPESPAPELGVGAVRKLLALPGDDLLGLRDRAILSTFFYSAARLSAVCALTVSDLHDDEEMGAELRLREKGDRIRTIGLHEAAAAAIRAYLDASGLSEGPLFRPARGPRSRELSARGFSRRGLRKLVCRYFRELPNGERYRPHSARATVATELLAAGEDAVKVQELLGHRDIKTTLAYDRRRRSTRESASHALPF